MAFGLLQLHQNALVGIDTNHPGRLGERVVERLLLLGHVVGEDDRGGILGKGELELQREVEGR